MKVVFLDFDGVIVTAHTHYHRGDPFCVHLLNDVIKKTGAKIVVSSAWRMGTPIRELRKTLKEWGVKGQIISKTPYDHSVERGEEIRRWLDAHPKVSSFVILDDDSDMGDLMPKLVKTHPHHGLDIKDAEIAIRILTTN